MHFFEDALERTPSTVLCGPYGRRPRLVKFYLDSVPDLETVSEYEPVFWHRRSRRLLTVLLEPPFDAFLPSDRWWLVLSSHDRLRRDPRAFRLVRADGPLERDLPLPSAAAASDSETVTPPASHVRAFLPEEGPVRVDLSGATCAHEAYLRLLTLCDALRPGTEWSLSMPERLRRTLAEELAGAKRGSLDAFLLRALG